VQIGRGLNERNRDVAAASFLASETVTYNSRSNAEVPYF
jgi:hypothetical protein